MKTYDEVFQNVIEATNAHHRKVKKIQNAVSASVVCAVCVIGASMYLKLEKPETVPPNTQTTTTTTMITETMDASSTGKFVEDSTELNFTNTNTIPVIINTVISETNQTETQITTHSNQLQSQQTTVVTTEMEDSNLEEITNTSEHSTSIKQSSTHTETKPTELTSSETKQTYMTHTTPSGHASSQTTASTKEGNSSLSEPTEPTEPTGPSYEPTEPTGPSYEPPEPTKPSYEPPEPTKSTGTTGNPSNTGIFTTATTAGTTQSQTTETQDTTSETTTTETTTMETTTTKEIVSTDNMIIQLEYEEDFIPEIEPISVYIDIDVKAKQTLTETICNNIQIITKI